MRYALEPKPTEIEDRHRGPAFIEEASNQPFANHGEDLDVKQLGSDEPFAVQSDTGTVAVVIVVRQGSGDYGRVDDDQRVSRSFRIASLAKRNETCQPLRCPIWSSSSSTFG